MRLPVFILMACLGTAVAGAQQPPAAPPASQNPPIGTPQAPGAAAQEKPPAAQQSAPPPQATQVPSAGASQAPAAAAQEKAPAAQPQAETPAKPPETKSASPVTEQIQEPSAAPAPASRHTGPGFMEPAQVKALLHKIFLAEFRINDLLTEVHPEKWKRMSDVGQGSFSQTLATLRKQLQSLDEWRTQFEKRPDSMYLGYQTYITISSVLPRLDGVAQGIAQNENASFGLQFSKAGNQLFDLQQGLEPYLSFLMKNQDELFYATQTNLASCQNELGFAMRPRVEPAIPMKNIMPELKGVHVREHNGGGQAAAASASAEKKEEKKAEKKADTKAKPTAGSAQKADAKPATMPAAKTEGKAATKPAVKTDAKPATKQEKK